MKNKEILEYCINMTKRYEDESKKYDEIALVFIHIKYILMANPDSSQVSIADIQNSLGRSLAPIEEGEVRFFNLNILTKSYKQLMG